jgi:geranylgeranyl pyrophosphate synthase
VIAPYHGHDAAQPAAWRAAVDAELGAMAADVPGEDDVSAAARYALGAGGKRLRPVLCLAAIHAAELQGGVTEGDEGAASAVYRLRVRAATAIELVHTYSLVHDDLPCMDDDDLRRGRQTVHRVHGTGAAMLAGFALIPLACRILADAAARLELDPARRAGVVAELCRGAGASGMVGGQQLDLDAETASLALDDLRRIHALKTGALFRASLRIGGILARADASVVDALGRFGDGLGLAFQITDDVLDETSDAAALGKTPGKDRDSGKSTFVSLLGVDAARAAARAEADAAVAALREAGIHSPLLEQLAGFAVGRDR